MATMLAAQATGLKRLRCDELPVPEMEPGMTLVKTRLASLCGSDLHIVYMGWTQFLLEEGDVSSSPWDATATSTY